MKHTMSRISRELDEYLQSCSRRSGLSKIQCSRLIASKLKEDELKILNKKKKPEFKFNFKLM